MSVSSVETKMPKMSEMAKPLKMGSSKMKKAPIMAASPVSTMGWVRVATACTTACAMGTPASNR